MSEHVTVEATRLALKFILSTDHEENQRSFLTSLKAFEDPIDRLSIAFNASRVLAMKIREAAQNAGQLDQVLAAVDLALVESLLDDPEDQP